MYLSAKHPVHAFKAALRLAWPVDVKFTGAFSLTIDCLFPRPARLETKSKREKQFVVTTKPDCDNLGKSVMDGLNGVAWDDDKQVCRLVVTKNYALSGRAGEVRILAVKVEDET